MDSSKCATCPSRACSELTFRSKRYRGKDIDLSLAFRLSGLTSGSKLELVQLSKSPSVVTVGLQLPESEAKGIPNGRLIDKFPSTTTFWLVLRKFEAGVAGGGSTRNLTARSVPSTDHVGSGAGRLFYEIPVIQAMGRELSTFTDLQKSLAQLGFNSGNILLRLSFRKTEEPREVAMIKIEDYFKSVASDEVAQEHTAAETTHSNKPAEQPEEKPSLDSTPGTVTAESTLPQAPPAVSASEDSLAQSSSSRPVTVFAPPSGNVPTSVQATHNESDYIPTVDHAQAHQRRLNLSSRPSRLPSDAEIAAKSAAEQERVANIKAVDVKVRFPDQSQVVAQFGNQDTGKSLYTFVRSCLAEKFAAEKFTLSFSPSLTGPALSGRKIQTEIPETEKSLLIKDLRMEGRVLVNLSWDAGASAALRGSKAPLLKPELQSQAQELKVELPPSVPDEPGPSVGNIGRSQGRSEPRKGGVPKWLKLPGKK